MIKAYAAMEAGATLQEYEYDPGPLGEHEVEINVSHCGICHSDLSMIDNEWGQSRYPLVPGHEVIGTIVNIGDQVKGLKTGQTVGLGWHAEVCEHCQYCDSGDHNLCRSAQPTIIGHHGGFADRVRATERCVIPLPDGLDAKDAGPLFCGGITVYNPLKQFDIKPTDRVAVIGIGGLGHLALQFLNAWGCDVTAFTSSDNKREEALEMGAHHTLNSKDADQIKSARDRFDMILSTVNVSLDWNSYLQTLRPRSRLHFVGVPTEPVPVMVPMLLSKQISVSASPIGSPATISEMLEFAARHNIKPVTEHYKFSEINEAIAHLESGKARYRLVLSHS